ncbi:MAG: glycosyltransferase [Ignavibacteria bacterium]|nr:glycosyltransferase [Ignavibacteria bacterium]
MSDRKINITVLMTVFNDEKYVGQSVKSILNQTYSDFEFLIIDDGSEDDSGKIINSIKDQRIIYKKIKHSGLAAALNFGMKNAKGDWIARADADDLSVNRRLQIQNDYLIKHPQTDVLGSHSVYFADPGKILFQLNPPSGDKKIKEFMDLHNPINHSSVIFRKEKILKVGGYDEKFGVYEDFELWLRMKNKLSFNIIPESLVYTRLRMDSMTSKGSRSKIYDTLVNNIRGRSSAFGKNPGDKTLAEKLFWIEYFYGDKNRARNYYSNAKDFRQILAFYNTYLPEKYFNKITGMRLRQRIESFKMNRKDFKKELNILQNLK